MGTVRDSVKEPRDLVFEQVVRDFNSGKCVKCGGTGVLGTPDFPGDTGPVTMSACDCEAGKNLFDKYRPGNKSGAALVKRMHKVAFESTLDGVLGEIHRIELKDAHDNIEGHADMSYYEAACRALLAQALYGIDEGTRLRAIQYIIDRKLGKAAQSVQVGRTDDYDPLEGMSAEEKKELLAIALAG